MKQSSLAVLTTYFNPKGFKTKKENFLKFISPLLSQNIFVKIVEAEFPPEHLPLGNLPNLIYLNGNDVLWQKERMLNIALQSIPKNFTKIAWIDADLLFQNPDWFTIAEKLLDDSVVVQLFEEAVRLPMGETEYSGKGDHYESFGSIIKKDPNCLLKGDFKKHGHTGFAWAIQRKVIEEFGFYDANIAGSGDHVMAHAFAGDWDSKCIERIIGKNKNHLSHFQNWAKNIYTKTRSKISYVPGRVLHLWHGDTENRKYVVRNNELAQFKYNPKKDVQIGKGGLWQWTRSGKRIEKWAHNYFTARQEDGEFNDTLGSN